MELPCFLCQVYNHRGKRSTVTNLCSYIQCYHSSRSHWPALAHYQLSQLLCRAPHPQPPALLKEEEQASCHGQGWLGVTKASCGAGTAPSHFHFIYLLALHPSTPCSASASGATPSPDNCFTSPSSLSLVHADFLCTYLSSRTPHAGSCKSLHIISTKTTVEAFLFCKKVVHDCKGEGK